MKKLLSIILAVALILPAAALADDKPFRITAHYSMVLDSYDGRNRAAKGGAIYTDFDSFTIDLYLTSDEQIGYYVETFCAYDTFFSSGFEKVKIVNMAGDVRIVDDSGNSYMIRYDDQDPDAMWIKTKYGEMKLHKVESFNTYTDKK